MSEVGSGAYPVQVGAEKPARFQRVQVLLRIGIGLVLSLISNNVLLLGLLLGPWYQRYSLVSAAAKGFMSATARPTPRSWRFLIGLQGYFFYATDEFPSWGKPGAVRYEYRLTGTPTIGSALLRILFVIPHAIALAVVGLLALLLALIATITVLINESVGHEIWRFLVGFVACEARVLTYHLSLVEEYPPFSLNFDEGAVSG